MPHRLPAYLLLCIVSWQLASLPLTYAWFGVNRAEIAATRCENRLTEPVPMCYGSCVLADLATAQLPEMNGDPEPTAPGNLKRLLSGPPALLPALPAPRLVPTTADRRRMAPNFHYLLRFDAGYALTHAPPPRRLS